MAEKSRLCDQEYAGNRPQTPETFEGIRRASERRKLSGLRGGGHSPERTVLRMADFPDNREFTGKIVKIGLQAANSPYNNRIFPYS
jgi:hypothetical protein